MKTILVTGGAGFIGTNFIRFVLSERPAWKIMNLDALTYAGNPMNLEDIVGEMADRYQFLHGDICDAGLLDKLFSENDFDGVVHFAAESHVDRSMFTAVSAIRDTLQKPRHMIRPARIPLPKHPRITLSTHITGLTDFRFLRLTARITLGLTSFRKS